ncbi:DeoR family transcriptional regulator [Stella humosa]|uniref:DeoR family transcriptional regulator n=1 Tax=Stella humosa TaxID=94 RepID=A0A3N1KXL0_9PROT|nr:DeoR/GlpR family DNA-binding transcription regulator [Stella humosa]ROP83509.1 DeoR family transcriptional regulator [Stella humosa]BBK33218.1 DeoR family transcriptional regulator [Stella humosa]
MDAEATAAAASPRQAQIVEMVGTRGFIPIDELARHFRVTAQTIRSDVNRLCRDGVLRRYHGGVGPVSTQENATFAKRRVQRHAEKVRIAALLAEHVPDHASLFLHYGTTMQAVAAALAKHRGLLVVTNNIGAVATLRPAEGMKILLVGGQVSPDEQCTQGQEATSFIDRFTADFGLISCGSVGPDGTLYEFGFEAAETARAITANARQVYLAIDAQKFDRKGLVKVGHISGISALFTDRPPPPAIAAILRDRGIPVHIAPGR